jgi:hypothetical protein
MCRAEPPKDRCAVKIAAVAGDDLDFTIHVAGGIDWRAEMARLKYVIH